MNEYLLWILLLSMWNVVLFYGKEYGVSVILFIIPLCLYMYYFLNKNKKVNNKKGLLLFIPICLLSLCYLLFNSEVFNVFNFIFIIVLLIFMFIYTINPTYDINEILNDLTGLLIYPFNYIGRLFRISKYKITSNGKLHLSDKFKKVLKSLLIVIPVSFVVIALLSSADMIFGNIFDNFFDKFFDILSDILFDDLMGKIISFVIIYFAIGCTSMYLLYDYNKERKVYKKNNSIKDQLTIRTLVSVLNVIYVIFDYIQIKSLLLHRVSSSINYAQYARQGFFELMVVSLINISIILISKKFENKQNDKDNTYLKVMNIIMVFLTIIILASSFLRMHMYEVAFGYTTLRVLVFAILITESILMIPTVMYIFNSEFNILKSYMIILLASYLIVNYMNVDYIVARRNVNRYYISNKIDLDYLKNYHTDNIPVLIELYNKTTDDNIKNDLEDYLHNVKSFTEENKNPFEFNFSKYKARKQIMKLKYGE